MDALSTTSMRRPLGGFIGKLFGSKSGDVKRCTAWADYGYPEHIGFEQFFNMFRRNGLARAGVMKHVDKSWQTLPYIQEGAEGDNPDDETQWESDIAQLFRRLHIWQRFQAADWRNRIGRYSALYIVFSDGKTPDQPVTGKVGLISIQPLYEAQLEPSDWDKDPTSDTYGQPIMYRLCQISQDDNQSVAKIDIHPDRVHILAEGADDGGIYGIPALEAGYNDLLTLEKVAGAGGEGFWKASRGAFSIEGDFKAQDLANAFGVSVDKVGDKLNETAANFASGLDKMLMLGGASAKPLTFSVPSPEQFYLNALYGFSASVSCPIPVLTGQQIGQRSSEENAKDWNATITARRRNFVTPNIEKFVQHLMRLGVIEHRDFWVYWDDLDSPSRDKKLDLAEKMSTINRNSMGTGEPAPFDPNEIREAAGYDTIDDDEYPDDTPAYSAEE
ncbi:anti-CBASS protein Acb1 family protein [Carnimonas bestiolae]|uniref:anti-CBASS protein Acb1 family protein n=1 Tax=Carnimonas bestiolae TaxID=3402172 RepID=UPI003EDC2482